MVKNRVLYFKTPFSKFEQERKKERKIIKEGREKVIKV